MISLEFLMGWGGIRFIFELHFAILVGEEEHLTRGVDHAAVEPVRLQHILGVKESQAAAAPVQCVVSRKIGHEALEVFNPGVMLITVEQVIRHLKQLHRRIEWVESLPLIVKEGVDVDPNPQLVLDGRDVGDLDGVMKLL